MIEDTELRELFSAESAEHLQNLDQGLMHLEQNPHDAERLKVLFREAHSLKGAARMIGVLDVEKVSHCFESVLKTASSSQHPLDSSQIDRLLKGLDEMRLLVREAVTGEPSGLELASILARLDASSPTSTPLAEKPTLKVPTSSAPESEPPASESIEEQPPQTIDTLRVGTRKLDQLLNQTSELTVARTRMKQRMKEMEEAIQLWESCERKLNTPGHTNRDITLLRESAGDLFEALGERLAALRQGLFEDDTGLALTSRTLEEGVQEMRLLPFSTLFNLFPRTVRDLAREQDKSVELHVEGSEVTADKRILEVMKAPLTHLVRNAIDHGLESSAMRLAQGKPANGTITLRAYHTASHVVLELEDDGGGLDLDAIRQQAIKKRILDQEQAESIRPKALAKIIFAPGFSTSRMVTDISGRGVGLDAARSSIESLKGTISVQSKPGKGCRFIIRIPLTLTSTPAFIVAVGSQRLALPLDQVVAVKRIAQDALFLIDGQRTFSLNDRPVSVAYLSDLLELPASRRLEEQRKLGRAHGLLKLPVVVVQSDNRRLGLLVDTLLDETEIVVKPHGPLLQRVRHISGATVLGDGSVSMVLNPDDLIQTVQRHGSLAEASTMLPDPDLPESLTETTAPPIILLADDSITTRTQEKRILETAGYRVVTAVDGLDAFNKLTEGAFDAVVSDVEMPNMNGIDLTRRIRASDTHQALPVLLVTSLSSKEDMQRGMEAGANAYISKTSFEQKNLLDALRRVV
ncbi:MAG: hybrid sensor histidine kinase/response regulator [Magnetococcales bacterium]|nr:hybrid sensor histidine kinase/response regulator [Magnetococcales bacterium]